MKSAVIPSIVALLFPLLSCDGEEQQRAGGPCSYTHRYTDIRLTGTDTVTWNQFAPRFVRVAGGGDTLRYERAGRHYLYRSELDTLDLRIGSVHQLEEMNIVSGHCTPHIVQILLRGKR